MRNTRGVILGRISERTSLSKRHVHMRISVVPEMEGKGREGEERGEGRERRSVEIDDTKAYHIGTCAIKCTDLAKRTVGVSSRRQSSFLRQDQSYYAFPRSRDSIFGDTAAFFSTKFRNPILDSQPASPETSPPTRLGLLSSIRFSRREKLIAFNTLALMRL